MKTADGLIEEIGDINDILDNIQILKKLIKLVDGYTEIQRLYDDNKIGDEAFVKKYSTFYQLRFVSDNFKSTYFAILQRLKNGENLTFTQIATELYNVDGKHQLSLITKLMHTANTSLPVYDSLVADALQLPPLTPDATAEQKIEESKNIVDGIASLYAELEQREDFKAITAELDSKIPSKVSFAKKCDIIVWALGTSKKAK